MTDPGKRHTVRRHHLQDCTPATVALATAAHLPGWDGCETRRLAATGVLPCRITQAARENQVLFSEVRAALKHRWGSEPATAECFATFWRPAGRAPCPDRR